MIEEMVVLMPSKPNQGEVLFEIVAGVEYATLRADDFRNAMSERDDLRNVVKAKTELAAKLVEQAIMDKAEIKRLQLELRPVTCTACNGWHGDGKCPDSGRTAS